MSEAARRSRSRSDRHRQSTRNRQLALAFVAGVALIGVVVALALMFTTPVMKAWPTSHTMRTAELELDSMWQSAAADAATKGVAVLDISDDHAAAWLNRLTEADPSDPLFAVSSANGSITAQYRLRLPFDLRPVVTMVLRPSLIEDHLFCAIESAAVGRCPLPVVLWRAAVGPVANAPTAGWVEIAGVLGYAWPARIGSPAGAVEMREFVCTPGHLTIVLGGGD